MRLDELPPHARKLVEAKLRADNPAPIAHAKRDVCDGLLEEKKGARFSSPCRVTFVSVRKRLADLDNLCGKGVLDQLVRERVLQDDSPEWVQEIRHRQVKGSPEETTIIIEEL